MTRPEPRFKEGDLVYSLIDEIDQDHHDRERVTPAGSIWEVTTVEWLNNNDQWHYSLVCWANGAWINPYDREIHQFEPLVLPFLVRDRLERQHLSFQEIKDVVYDFRDEVAEDERVPDFSEWDEIINKVEKELRLAGLAPNPG